MNLHQQSFLSETAFAQWLSGATDGQAIEYHRGFLAVDTDETTSPLSADDRLQLRATAGAVYRAAEQGRVHLLQRRLGPHQFSYLAIRRGSRPREAFPCATK